MAGVGTGSDPHILVIGHLAVDLVYGRRNVWPDTSLTWLYPE